MYVSLHHYFNLRTNLISSDCKEMRKDHVIHTINKTYSYVHMCVSQFLHYVHYYFPISILLFTTYYNLG